MGVIELDDHEFAGGDLLDEAYPPVSLLQLEYRCLAGHVEAQIDVCVAAAELCGGDYSGIEDVDDWGRALHDLKCYHSALRCDEQRWHDLADFDAAWDRADWIFRVRFHAAIARFDNDIAAEAEQHSRQETTMPATKQSAKRSTTVKRSRAKSADQTVPLRLEKRLKVSGGITVREHTSRHIWTLKVDVTDAKVGAVFEIDHDPQESPYDSEEEAVSSAFWGLVEWVDDLRLSYPEEAQRLVDVRAQLLAQASRLLGASLDRHRPKSTPRSIPDTQEQASAKESAAGDPAAVHSLVGGKTARLCRGCGTHNDGAETECGKCGADLRDSAVSPSDESLREILLGEIVPSEINPRQTFDGEALNELAESITTHGLLQPIVVMALRRGTQHRYEIIAGERRYRAARLAGLETILCRVLDCTAEQAIELRVTENLQRVDLNPIEEARGFQQLIEHCGYSQRDLAARLNVSQGKIGNALGLLRLPADWQERLSRREITATMARDLVPHADDELVLGEALKRLESQSDWTARSWNDAVREIAHVAHGSAPARDQAEGTESNSGKDAHPSDSAAEPFGPPPVRPERIEEYRFSWLAETWSDYLNTCTSTDEHLERLLKTVGITIQSYWRVDREFLELFSKAELFELVRDDWCLELAGLDNPKRITRQTIIEMILAEDARKPLPLPRCLR